MKGKKNATQEGASHVSAARRHPPIEVTCAFCQGVGTDQFGVMSPLSTCVVCGGTGKRTLRAPTTNCAFCQGTGVYPQTRLTCIACGGVGAVSVPDNPEPCPNCGGTGRAEDDPEHSPDSPFYCLHCHGAGVVAGKDSSEATPSP